MKVKHPLGTRIWYRMMLFILCLVSALTVFVLFFRDVSRKDAILIAATAVTVVVGGIQHLRQFAPVTLTEQGIEIHRFPHARILLWNELVQVGILKQRSLTGDYNELVLLLPGGTPRSSDTFEFLGKNHGKLLYLPCTPPVIQYVTDCYGPLDFDLTDN